MFTRMLGVMKVELDRTPALTSAALKGDRSKAKALLTQLLALDNQYDALANRIGLNICGKPTSR